MIPNHRGPTGDGYGPPVAEGAAVPPPVSAVSYGGGAAGIQPSFSRLQKQFSRKSEDLETAENHATTVRI